MKARSRNGIPFHLKSYPNLYFFKCRIPDIRYSKGKTIVFVTDICLTCYRNNPMRTNEDVSHYTTLAGNCFKCYFDIFQSLVLC